MSGEWRPFLSDFILAGVLNPIVDSFDEHVRSKILALTDVEPHRGEVFLRYTVGISCLTYLRFCSEDHPSPKERLQVWERLAKLSQELLDTLRQVPPSMKIKLELEARALANIRAKSHSLFSLYIQPTVMLNNGGELVFVPAQQKPFLENKMQDITLLRDASLSFVRVHEKNKRRGRPTETVVREAVGFLLFLWEEYASGRATQTKSGRFEQYVELSLRPALPSSWNSKTLESPIQDVLDGTWTEGFAPIATVSLESMLDVPDNE